MWPPVSLPVCHHHHHQQYEKEDKYEDKYDKYESKSYGYDYPKKVRALSASTASGRAHTVSRCTPVHPAAPLRQHTA